MEAQKGPYKDYYDFKKLVVHVGLHIPPVKKPEHVSLGEDLRSMHPGLPHVDDGVAKATFGQAPQIINGLFW